MSAGPRPASLGEMVAATPDSRDRFMDFLRAASIITVVFGHWFIGVIYWHDGIIGSVSAIGLTSWLWMLTWAMQVIPLFFFVGGFANRTSWRSFRAKGRSEAEWMWTRAERLLKPSLIFVGVWVVIQVILHLTDTGGVRPSVPWLRGMKPPGATIPFGPLWFLAVYLVVVMASPVTLRLHERFGLAVPVAMIAGAIAVDVLRFILDLEGIGFANVWLVFLACHQLGYFYADGRLQELPKRAYVAMAATGLAVMLVLTNLDRVFTTTLYPKSLLGTDVEKITNTNPPTLMMLAMGIWSIGVVMLLRPVLSRWLKRPRVWGSVIYLNTVVMTLFLWHMTAFLLALLVLWPLGFGQQGDTTASWWIERPMWEIVPALFLVPLVWFFGRFERPAPRKQ
jgi:fucose 4-O-acetylase-like acetyltransferase